MDTHSSAKRGAQLPEARQDQESETLEEPQAKYSKAAGKGNLTPQQPNPPASEERDRSQTRQRTDNRRSQDRAYPDSSSDQRRGQGQDKWWQRNWNRDKSDKDSKEVQDLKALVKDLSRLVLRQSDALSYLQLDVGFMLFLKTTMTPHLEKEPEAAVDWTIVPNLYKVATKWHTDKEKAPDTLVTTLRTTLFPTGPGHGHVAEAPGPRATSHPGNHGREHLPLSQVEPRHQEARQGGAGAPHLGANSSVARDHQEVASLSQGDHEVPCASAHDAADVGRGRAVHAGDPQSLPGGPSGVSTSGENVLQLPVALGGRHNAPQQARPGPAGEIHRGVCTPLRLEPQALQGLVFGNKASFCYANSTLMSLLWMHSQTGILLDPPSPDLRLALQKVLQGADRTRHLWSCALWRRAIRPWPSGGQQDAAEFLQTLCPLLYSTVDKFEWEARHTPRSLDVPSEVSDSGTLLPLPLTVALASDRDNSTTLQALVDAWHVQRRRDQATVCAATDGPPFLLAQVARFNDSGAKVQGIIKAPYVIDLPIFNGSGCQTYTSRYTAHCLVFHLGVTSRSGHYRAAMLRQGKIAFTTDDNRKLQPVEPSEVSTILENSYIFFLSKHQEDAF